MWIKRIAAVLPLCNWWRHLVIINKKYLDDLILVTMQIRAATC